MQSAEDLGLGKEIQLFAIDMTNSDTKTITE